jgi:membrane fusion protein, multidrug efflux system
MDDKRKKIIGGIGSVVLLLAIYFVYEHIMYVDTDNAQVEAPTVMLAAKVNGFLTKVNVTEGQKVKKDQMLVEIDNRDYKSMYQSADSELQSLEARKRDAEKSYARLRELHAENVISSQQYDTALANYNETRAKYDSAVAKLTQAKLNLDNTEIKAPSDGVVAKTSAEIGQLAAVGVPLIGFISSESRWITANFKETEIEDVKVGNKVDIKIDAISGKKYEGEVETISPATGATFTLLPPDNATGNFTKVVQRVPVRIKFKNISTEEYENIRAGLSAQVKIHIR